MALELVPLCTLTASLRPPVFIPGTPSGTRIIAEVISVEVKGERLNGRMVGAVAADWLTVGPDPTIGSVDVRWTLETDDGALALVQYNGRLDMSQTPPVAYVAPRFEIGDERYAWLARAQCVAKGTFSEDLTSLTYEMYTLA
jgi:hypothetical protein